MLSWSVSGFQAPEILVVSSDAVKNSIWFPFSSMMGQYFMHKLDIRRYSDGVEGTGLLDSPESDREMRCIIFA